MPTQFAKAFGDAHFAFINSALHYVLDSLAGVRPALASSGSL